MDRWIDVVKKDGGCDCVHDRVGGDGGDGDYNGGDHVEA